MLIIIDANVASEFTLRSPDALAVISWIENHGRVSTGGLNLEELLRTRLREYVIQLLNSGRGIRCSKDNLALAQRKVNETEICSDDPHVLALALAGGARILYTRDRALMRDFTNRSILPPPPGKCYGDRLNHKHLLRTTSARRRRKSKS
jgi:predicted nucleic acid-binding protein